MKLSVIMPVFNEKDTIREVIKRVLSVDVSPLGLERELVVVDDGSTDGTRELLKQYQESSVKSQVDAEPAGLTHDARPARATHDDIKVIFHEKNRGKGAALRTGFEGATGDILLIQDADLELDPEEQPMLIAPIIEGKTKVVFGSRFRKKINTINPATLAANKIFTFFANLLYRAGITDVMNCYKVMHREVIGKIKLRSDKFDVEPELAAKICKNGYKIYEVPVSYNPRKFSKGKKIRFSDSFPVLWALFKYRFID